MGQTASQCKLSSSADPMADTVQVNPTLLSGPTDGTQQGKLANEGEIDQEEQESEEKVRQEAEERRLREEQLEKERLQAEQERLQAEQERLQAEQERRQAEEEEARRQAEIARKKAEEEEAERQRIEAKRLEEAAARERLAQEQEQIAGAQKEVHDFLKANGFKHLSLPKKAICGAPLSAIHIAVEKNNPALVQAMVRCNADLHQKGPGKKTPLEFAEQCNKGGSHDAVVKVLRGES